MSSRKAALLRKAESTRKLTLANQAGGQQADPAAPSAWVAASSERAAWPRLPDTAASGLPTPSPVRLADMQTPPPRGRAYAQAMADVPTPSPIVLRELAPNRDGGQSAAGTTPGTAPVPAGDPSDPDSIICGSAVSCEEPTLINSAASAELAVGRQERLSDDLERVRTRVAGWWCTVPPQPDCSITAACLSQPVLGARVQTKTELWAARAQAEALRLQVRSTRSPTPSATKKSKAHSGRKGHTIATRDGASMLALEWVRRHNRMFRTTHV